MWPGRCQVACSPPAGSTHRIRQSFLLSLALDGASIGHPDLGAVSMRSSVTCLQVSTASAYVG